MGEFSLGNFYLVLSCKNVPLRSNSLIPSVFGIILNPSLSIHLSQCFNDVFVCEKECAHEYLRRLKASGTLGLEIQAILSAHHGCWEPNLGLQKQLMLLTAVPAL